MGSTAKEVFSLDLSEEEFDYLQNDVMTQIQSWLTFIFGDKFSTIVPKGYSYLQYAHGYTIYSQEKDILMNIGIGGEHQNNTVLFSLTGTGCKLAHEGWEEFLYISLKSAINPKITRMDLCHDDLEGDYSSFELANQAETDNHFVLPKTRNRPSCTISGEFKHGDPNNKGLTLYVGSRKNGKVFRGYEKGKQLGDPKSKWFRSEIEVHAKARVIPLEVLLKPTEFFCGAYPYCLDLVHKAKKNMGDHSPQKVDTMPSIKRQAKISLNRALHILKTQFGKYFKVFTEIFTNADTQDIDYKTIVDNVITDKTEDYYPKRLKFCAHYFNNNKTVRQMPPGLSPIPIPKTTDWFDGWDEDEIPDHFLKSSGFALTTGHSP